MGNLLRRHRVDAEHLFRLLFHFGIYKPVAGDFFLYAVFTYRQFCDDLHTPESVPSSLLLYYDHRTIAHANIVGINPSPGFYYHSSGIGLLLRAGAGEGRRDSCRWRPGVKDKNCRPECYNKRL